LLLGTNPRACDLEGTGGGAADGRLYRSIYALDGDSLTLCNGWGAKRPTALPAQPGDCYTVYGRPRR
jgi:uncharacterized protein (TIGR03067 family)